MNFSLAWDNLVTYSLQVGLLIGLTAFIPTVLRLRQPKAKLYFWYLLLVTCLALPALRPWKREMIAASVQAPPPMFSAPPFQPVKHTMPRSQMALLALAAGAAFRLAWLAAGFWKLRRYRRHSSPWTGESAWRVNADLRISEAITSPVTFGFLNPVILLPGQFPELDHAKQDAILCHEVLHVWRHDWLFTIGEELVRALFWFHPAIWWLLGEIQLAREQAVDREVVSLTSRRDEYLDALLAIAGASAQLDLAPAPLFLRKRHLKQRVVSILKEARMSKTRLISAFATSLLMLAAACWFVTGAFPLAAEPQMVTDGPGVTVETSGSSLIHRNAVGYPQIALTDRVEGTVTVQVKIGSNGEVVDASVMSGPDELRRGVLTSVLNWHFTHDAANSTRQVSVNFQLPKVSASTAPSTLTVETDPVAIPAQRAQVLSGVVGGVPGGVRGGVIGGIVGAEPIGGIMTPKQPAIPGKVTAITTLGLSDQARTELLARLPIHEGDTITSDSFRDVVAAVKQYDEHLNVGVIGSGTGETRLQIFSPNQSMSMSVGMAADIPTPPGAIRVGGNIQQAKLTSQPRPVYPALAKQARISGVVHLYAVIGKDGTVKDLRVISGHPLLIQAAMEAVRQWTYQITLLNGAPVDVVTQIDVNFTLSE